MSHRFANADACSRSVTAFLAAALLVASVLVTAAPASADAPDRRVIVTGIPGAAGEVVGLVEAVGGEIIDLLPIVNGVVADVPAAGLEAIAADRAVHSVSDDEPLLPASVETADEEDGSPDDTEQTDAGDAAVTEGDADDGVDSSSPVYHDFDAGSAKGSLALHNREVIGSAAFWEAGFTGQGVDVAVIDTGIATVAGLDAGQVLHGPDLSFDSQTPWAQTDGYGHGTHLSGIIGGREASHIGAPAAGDTDSFLGVAPSSRLVSLKIGDHGGAADVSQAIAAIDWVISHRDVEGLNIRVLNLSFGYDSSQPYTSDPLAYAAEQAWKHGIVVVAAAGNGGHRSRLSSPAYNPHIIAVGATDSNMTATATDDVIPAWSSCDPNRNPDVVAPGRSVVSLRVPGSYVDSTFSRSKVTGTLSRGSGTSQSTAFVSGAAALILSQRPEATPDEVRALLTSTAQSIQRSAPKRCQGHGVIDLRKAVSTATPATAVAMSSSSPSRGTGTLEAARGGYRVLDSALPQDHPDRVLTGERDIFGNAWSASAWARSSAAGDAFSRDGYWNGAQWTGAQWTGAQWTGAQWTGAQWTSDAWSGSEWYGAQWTGAQWTGAQWTGAQWTGAQWTGAQWTGAQWTGAQWTGAQWTGFLSARWE